MIKREIMPYVWVHPDEARHVLGECHSEQARAMQDKTGNGHSEQSGQPAKVNPKIFSWPGISGR